MSKFPLYAVLATVLVLASCTNRPSAGTPTSEAGKDVAATKPPLVRFNWSASEDFTASIFSDHGERWMSMFPSCFAGFNSVWGFDYDRMSRTNAAARKAMPSASIGYYTTWGFYVNARHDVWTKLIDGTDGDSVKDLYWRSHLPSLANQAYLDSFPEWADKIQKAGFNRFLVGDSHYPIGPGYLPGGYAESDIIAFRKVLKGEDEGIKFSEGAHVSTLHFKDYFKRYYGFEFTPADVGLKTWGEFSPPTLPMLRPDPAGGSRNKMLLLWYNLIRYEFLRFNAYVDDIMNKRGLEVQNILIPELPLHGVDEVGLISLPGINRPLFERFDDSFMVYFQDLASDERIQRLRWYGRITSGSKLGLMGELGHNGNRTPYWSPGFSFVTWFDLRAASDFAEVHHDFLEQAEMPVQIDKKYVLNSPEQLATGGSPRQKYRNGQLFMSGAGANTAVEDGVSDARPRRLLYLGDRPLIRRTWHLQKFSNDIGYLSQILLAWAIPFDFADSSLIGVNLNDYDVVIYNSIDLPDGLMDKLADWLKGSPARRLIAHGSLPTHRINDPAWVAGLYYTEDSPELLNKIIAPQAGNPIGLSRITASDPIAGKTASGTLGGPWNMDPISGQGSFQLQSDLPSKVLLETDGRPLVTEIGKEKDGKTIYIHYDCGRLKNASFDTQVILALLARSKITPLADGNTGVSVHSYTSSKDPGSIFVVRNRSALQKQWLDDGRGENGKSPAGTMPEKAYWGGFYPQLLTKTTLYLPPGRYKVYQFLNDSLSEVNATASGLPLEIANQTGEIVVVVPANEPDTLIKTWQKHRRQHDAWLNLESEKAFGLHAPRTR
ncbi:MAG: hypothetical protein WAX69_23745 [Victivallales bacterium]